MAGPTDATDLPPALAAAAEKHQINLGVLDERTFGEKAGDFVKSIPGKVVEAGRNVVDAVRGNATLDIQELGPEILRLKMRAKEGSPERDRYTNALNALNLARTPEQQRAAVKKYFPGAYVGTGEDGGDVAKIGNEFFYINRPGLSAQDVNAFGTEAALMTAEAMPLAAGGRKLLGFPGQVVGTGAGAGGASLTQDWLYDKAMGGGTDTDPTKPGAQTFNLERATQSGGVASLVEMIAPPVLSLLVGAARTAARGGGLSAADQRILQRAGIDTAGLTPATLEAIARLQSTTGDPVAAARQGRAQSLPYPLTLSTGQATRSRTQLGFESEAQKGTFGPDAERAAVTTKGPADEGGIQQQRLQDNIGAIRSTLNPNGTIAPGDGAAATQETLSNLRRGMWQQTDLAFDNARAQTPTFFTMDATEELGRNMRAAVKTYDVNSLPRAQSLLQTWDAEVAAARGAKATGMNLKAYETWRARAVNAASDAEPQEKAAIRTMISTLDRRLAGDLNDALLSGDPAAIDAWRAAINSRARFGQIFESDNVVNDLTRPAKGKGNGSVVLAVPADKAVEVIFGRAALGTRTSLEPDLKALQSALAMTTEGEKQWGRIKEEAFLRLLKSQRPSQEGVFSAANYKNELENALRSTPRAMQVLFEPEEINLMRQLADVAMDVSYTPRVVGNTNPSGTAAAAALLQKLGFLGTAGRAAAEWVLNPIARNARTAQTSRAMGGALPAPSPFPPGFAGAAGGAAGN